MKFINDAIKESEKREKPPSSSMNSDIDSELREIIENSRARIYVVGTGGAGNNTVTRLSEIGVEGAETIAINTDAQDLFYTVSDRKLLIGRNVCGGLGAGGIPEVGEECAEESEDDIRRELEGADMVFVT